MKPETMLAVREAFWSRVREVWDVLAFTFDFDVFACVRCGGRLEGLCVREGGPPGCGRFWSTWACPRHVRGWPRHEGHPRPRGVEAQDSQQSPATHLIGARPGQACTPATEQFQPGEEEMRGAVRQRAIHPIRQAAVLRS